MQECFCVIQYELSEVFNQFESLIMICSFTILWLFFDLATLSLAGATPWSASVPQSCWSRCCVSAPCTLLLLLVLCVCALPLIQLLVNRCNQGAPSAPCHVYCLRCSLGTNPDQGAHTHSMHAEWRLRDYARRKQGHLTEHGALHYP